MTMSTGEFWVAVALMAGATYATRLPGLLLVRPLPGFLGRALAALPPAVFAALALPALLVSGGTAAPAFVLRPSALVPAALAWVVARWTGQAAAGLGIGFAAALAMRVAGL